MLNIIHRTDRDVFSCHEVQLNGVLSYELISNFTGNIFKFQVSYISAGRFNHRPHGPFPRVFPRLRRLQCGRCAESWLWLTLGHSIHHLCASQPLPSSLCHALPSPLPLLSLSENHIG